MAIQEITKWSTLQRVKFRQEKTADISNNTIQLLTTQLRQHVFVSLTYVVYNTFSRGLGIMCYTAV